MRLRIYVKMCKSQKWEEISTISTEKYAKVFQLNINWIKGIIIMINILLYEMSIKILFDCRYLFFHRDFNTSNFFLISRVLMYIKFQISNSNSLNRRILYRNIAYLPFELFLLCNNKAMYKLLLIILFTLNFQQ